MLTFWSKKVTKSLIETLSLSPPLTWSNKLLIYPCLSSNSLKPILESTSLIILSSPRLRCSRSLRLALSPFSFIRLLLSAFCSSIFSNSVIGTSSLWLSDMSCWIKLIRSKSSFRKENDFYWFSDERSENSFWQSVFSIFWSIWDSSFCLCSTSSLFSQVRTVKSRKSALVCSISKTKD